MKDNIYFNQSIDCSVYNCDYCDCDNNKCSLSQIKISNMNNQHEKKSTICDSFKNRC